MTDSIIVALISGGLALAGTILSNLFANSKTLYRIQQLEKKQDQHNNMIERMYLCEGQIKLLEEKQAETAKDVDDIKSHFVVKGVV